MRFGCYFTTSGTETTCAATARTGFTEEFTAINLRVPLYGLCDDTEVKDGVFIVFKSLLNGLVLAILVMRFYFLLVIFSKMNKKLISWNK